MRAALVVVGDGPGFPEREHEAVFAHFRRRDASYSCETGGVDLGRSITQAIDEDRAGDDRLANWPEGGLRAEISLPLKRAARPSSRERGQRSPDCVPGGKQLSR